MGHINHDDLRKMVCKGMVTGIELDMDSKPEYCESCTRAKATRKPFPKKSKSARRTVYGGKVVGDTFQDRHSHEERAYFMRKKSEALDKYKEFEAWVKVQRKHHIEIFGSDGGGEFKSSQNGTSERSHRVHVECARAMLNASGLPKYLWAEAWLHSVWLRNRAPTSATRGEDAA